MRRTNRRAGLVVSHYFAPSQLQQLLATLGSASPRYLLHGVAFAVGLGTIIVFALQPRAPAPVVEESSQVVAADVSPPLVVLEPAPTTTESVAAATEPPPASPDVDETPVATAPPQPVTHMVEEGESVRMLAAKYSLDPVTILAANNLNDPDVLQIGQELIILPTDGVLYTLRPGETLRRVAEAYGVAVTDIVAANDLGENPDIVQPGTRLVVPGATPAWPRRRATTEPGEPELAIASVGGGRLPIESATRVIPSTRTYEVQPGDTLAGIAEGFGVDVATILSSNGIDNPNTIKPGSELRILPVKGLEYTIDSGESLAEIAWKYQVDLGLLLDYNDLNDPDMIHVGGKLVIPGGSLRPEAVAAPAAPAVAVAPRTQPGAPAAAVSKPAAQAAPKPAAPAAPAPQTVVGRGGANVVANAMKFLGYRYRFGGTSPAGFDCSGFVYYIHNQSGSPVGRGMWQQYNGGPRIPQSALQPGDTVFFANTYMPGLSHDGIYIGGGQFIHASDERTGVTISSIHSGYWASKYVGATRLWN